MVKIKKILDVDVGGFHVVMETFEEDRAGPHDYRISRRAWVRAIEFIRRFGVEGALEVIDERAMRAGDRRDFETSRRWRELITAIHAMTEEEQLPGENTH
jgi:hypothetical protein